MIDPEERAQADREARQAQRLADKQFRSDVQAVFATNAGRRLLWAFLQDAGHDVSAYRENPVAMAFATGWHDAAAWWVDVIRRHCPEREALMRNEAREAARSAPQDNSDD